MDATLRVRAAIAAGGDEYFTKCCEMRAARSGKAMGSSYPYTTESLKKGILSLAWDLYEDAAIEAPGVGCIAREFGGNFRMKHINKLPDTAVLELSDPKGTGYAEACLAGSDDTPHLATFTVAILGPNKEGAEVLWTFFPGPPVTPSRVPTDGWVKRIVSAKEAKALGISWVKLA